MLNIDELIFCLNDISSVLLKFNRILIKFYLPSIIKFVLINQ